MWAESVILKPRVLISTAPTPLGGFATRFGDVAAGFSGAWVKLVTDVGSDLAQVGLRSELCVCKPN